MDEIRCNHFAMEPVFENGALTYTCVRCGIEVFLSQRKLGKVVEKQLRKRGMLNVMMGEFHVEPEQEPGVGLGDESSAEGGESWPESPAPAGERRVLYLPE